MKIEKVEKLAANLHDKTECFVHIRNSKQSLNHGLILKKVRRVIKFNQKKYKSKRAKIYSYLKDNNDEDKKARSRKMFDYITKEVIKEHNANWPEIPDHPYRILIAGGSGYGNKCIG